MHFSTHINVFFGIISFWKVPNQNFPYLPIIIGGKLSLNNPPCNINLIEIAFFAKMLFFMIFSVLIFQNLILTSYMHVLMYITA